jgi:hypothetical protein
MANEYILHKTVSNIRMLADAVLPELDEEMLVAVARGRVITWAVYVEHDMATCEWRIGKVEPWDAYKHINSERHGAIRVYGRDELDAYMTTKRAMDKMLPCEEH